MEPVTAYPLPLKCSLPKAKVFVVFLSMLFCTAVLFLLQMKLFKPKPGDFYSFQVKDLKGKIVSLKKFRGKSLQRKSPGEIFGNISLTPRGKLSNTGDRKSLLRTLSKMWQI
ncbi:probable glutathione peroxidase 8 isoform X2 [Latimeria chalumnae]|uniref:probable glutathione peroxidase 8 isoform X2 n=1 Tax=Latimeria chalumnae TaxID=7897 RepID=UPI00313EC2E5